MSFSHFFDFVILGEQIMKYAYSIRTTSELISVLLRHNFNYIDSNNVSGISYELKLKKNFFWNICMVHYSMGK